MFYLLYLLIEKNRINGIETCVFYLEYIAVTVSVIFFIYKNFKFVILL